MTELVERESAGMLPATIPANADVMSIGYDQLIDSGEFYAVPGFGLVDDKMMLCGVPHVIIGVTFQIPTPARPRGYVSLRGIIGTAAKLAEAKSRKWIPNGADCAFNPEERIIYNDGSTGIRRQVVELLDRWGLIEVGNHDFKANDNFPNRFDLPWTEWVSFSQDAVQGENIVPEFSTNHNGNLFALQVTRGLRVSEYSNDKADDARTFYL
jgi:hypothetical protein